MRGESGLKAVTSPIHKVQHLQMSSFSMIRDIRVE
jgi:hypothetical protein